MDRCREEHDTPIRKMEYVDRAYSFHTTVFYPVLCFEHSTLSQFKLIDSGQDTYGVSPFFIHEGSQEISSFRFVQHSQMTTTRHPAPISVWMERKSLSMFAVNFFCHLSVLLLGVVAYWHFECLCQKHPCTKIAVWYLGSTISGSIFNILVPRRYLNPWA